MAKRIKSGEKIGGIDKEKLQESFKSNPELLKKINDMLEWYHAVTWRNVTVNFRG